MKSRVREQRWVFNAVLVGLALVHASGCATTPEDAAALSFLTGALGGAGPRDTPGNRAVALGLGAASSYYNNTANQGVARAGAPRVNVNVESNGGSARTASAKINKVWIDYDPVEVGEGNLMVHVECIIYHNKGRPTEVTAYFYHNNGTMLRDTNQAYYSTDGQVAVSETVYPIFEELHYLDFNLSIPISELTDAGSGRTTLKLKVQVWDRSQSARRLLATSGWTRFWVTR